MSVDEVPEDSKHDGESAQVTPLRVPGQRVSPAGEGRVILATSDGTLVELNATAAALLDLCDGATEVAEMIDAVAALFALPRQRAADDVHDALSSMSDAGLIR